MTHELNGPDSFWNEEVFLFKGSFSYFRNLPQRVLGKIHTSDERYFDTKNEIVPLTTRTGNRTYVMMKPVIMEPNIVLTVALQSKYYADAGEQTTGTVQAADIDGVHHNEIGHAQAWYYKEDKMLVLWECFLHGNFQETKIEQDSNMRALWQGFESWLLSRFLDCTQIVTPFSDPLFPSKQYQSFLRSFGYEQIGDAVFGKTL